MQGPVEMDLNLAPKAELPTKWYSRRAPVVIHEAPGSGPPVYELPSGGREQAVT
jgi:hypothetical protein